jgi:NAD(P)-dependent dehydrogenase (short-subunit alcohol dehydrogenase family)
MAPSSPFRTDLLRDRVALVTGGSGGLGSSVVERLLTCGARVVIASRDAGRCEEVASRLADHGRSWGVGIDIRDPDQCDSLVRKIAEREGKLDILVNAAGGGFVSALGDLTLNGLLGVLRLNLLGAFNITKSVEPLLRSSGGGSIVHVVSPVTQRPMPGLVHVGAAKLALIHLVQGWALEWAEHGIRVNCVAPGVFFTEGARDAIVGDAKYAALTRDIPMGRHGAVGELADAVTYMASEASSYVTGQCVYVDGGLFTGKGVSYL